MIDISITINLSAEDPVQLGAQLAAIIQGAHALTGIEIEPTQKNGPESVETDVRRKNTHAATPTANGTPTTPAKQQPKRGRPKKVEPELPDRFAQWYASDELVRSEMERLGTDKRMPTTAQWNSNRDVRLPTMAGILQAYDVPDLLALAAKLEMRPPLSALGVEPFVTATGEA